MFDGYKNRQSKSRITIVRVISLQYCHTMLPIEAFRLLFYKYLFRMGKSIGIEYVKPTYRKHSIRTTLFWMLVIAFIIAQTYTCFTQDVDSILKGLSITTTVSQGTFKFHLINKEHVRFRNTTEYLLSIYKNSERSPIVQGILDRWIHRFILLFKVIIVVETLTGSMFILYPVIVYVRTGIVDTPMPLVFPFVDRDTLVGYVTLYAYHSINVAVAVCGMCMIDCTVFMSILHVCPMSEIFVSKLSELEDNLMQGEELKYSRQLQQYLFNIVRMHQEICTFLNRLAELVYGMFIVEVLLDAVTMCVVLFSTFLVSYIPLYFMFITFFVKLLVSCTIGTMAELQKDKILDATFNFKWYRLSLKDRKIYMLMLHRAQNMTVLMAGTAPLNMELFVGVMKNTYNFAMCLLNMM